MKFSALSINRSSKNQRAKGRRRGNVYQLENWDTTFLQAFPTADVSALSALVLGELDRLLKRSAIDSAHTDILDTLVAELFAPLYENSRAHFSDGVKILEVIEQQGVEEAVRANRAATVAASEAASLQLVADTIYERVVGVPRVSEHGDSPALDEESKKLRDRRLRLEPGMAPLDFAKRTFRGQVRQASTNHGYPLRSASPESRALPTGSTASD